MSAQQDISKLRNIILLISGCIAIASATVGWVAKPVILKQEVKQNTAAIVEVKSQLNHIDDKLDEVLFILVKGK